MKKIFSLLVLGSLLCVLVMPVMVSAQEAPEECCILNHAIDAYGVTGAKKGDLVKSDESGAVCTASTTGSTYTSSYWGTICLLNTIYGVTNLLFVILMALAILFFIYGGLTMVMASGDTEKFTTGKNYIMYALYGIVVALLAKAFPSIIKTVMGV